MEIRGRSRYVQQMDVFYKLIYVFLNEVRVYAPLTNQMHEVLIGWWKQYVDKTH